MEKKLRGIYQILNLSNNKYYIGSSCNIRKRWWEHKKKLNNGTHHNQHLLSAWKKYGEDCFEFSILKEMPEATKKEIMDEEQLLLNKHYSQLGCYNLSKNAFVPNPELNWKPVNQINKITGEHIKTWNSIIEASQSLFDYKDTYATGIMNCCRGRRGSFKGYIWEYAESELAKKFARGSIKHGGHGKKIVIRVSPENPTLEICRYSSLIEAANSCGIKNYNNVTMVCSGKRKSTNGMVFRYLDDFLLEKQKKEQSCEENFWQNIANDQTWDLKYLKQNLNVRFIDLSMEKGKKNGETAINQFVLFSDEWKEKPDLIRSMISNRLGKTTNKIYARKCVLSDVPFQKAKDFFSENHIDGYVKAKKIFGLYYNDELVCALSIRKPFIISKYKQKLEIARFATKKNFVVIGGFGKILKSVIEYAKINKFISIISYCDIRFGTGKVYSSTGFKCISENTGINYWYTDGKRRFNRFKFRAQNGLTEKEVAENNKVYKVFGCGNALFEYELKTDNI